MASTSVPDHMRLLAQIDWDLQRLFKMVESLCNEAGLDDQQIASILADGDSEALEIIADEAGSLRCNGLDLIVETRLAIRDFLGKSNDEAGQ